VAQQGSQAASTLASKVKTATEAADPSTRTTTDAAGDTTVTKTVTSPAQTSTVTKTEVKTETAPAAQSTTSGGTTKVGVVPASETPNNSNHVPTWGWILIGLAAAGLALGIYLLGRGHGRVDERSGGPGGPPSRPTGGGLAR
jgi:cobalamin biosynthesis Mg chelatase CobN